MKIFTALMLAKFFDSNDRAYLDLRSFVDGDGDHRTARSA